METKEVSLTVKIDQLEIKLEKLLALSNRLELDQLDIQTTSQIRSRRMDKISCRLDNLERHIQEHKDDPDAHEL